MLTDPLSLALLLLCSALVVAGFCKVRNNPIVGMFLAGTGTILPIFLNVF